MLQIHCDVCGEELIEPGDLLFGHLDPMSRTTNNSSTSSFSQKTCMFITSKMEKLMPTHSFVSS
jgi:hypothetical protein